MLRNRQQNLIVILCFMTVLCHRCYSVDFVLVADSTDSGIFKSVINTTMTQLSFSVVDLSLSPVNPRRIDVDPVERKMYWSDTYLQKIFRASLDGSNQEAILDSNDVRGISLDLVNRKLYWVDRLSGNLSKSNLDGSNAVVLMTDLLEPRVIIVYPQYGSIYVAERKYILLIDMPSITTNATFDVGGFITGLTIDIPGQAMYWCDSTNERIQTSSLQFENIRTLIDMLPLGHTQSRGLVLYGSSIYWINLGSALYRADKDTGGNIEMVGGKVFPSPNGFHIFEGHCTPTLLQGTRQSFFNKLVNSSGNDACVLQGTSPPSYVKSATICATNCLKTSVCDGITIVRGNADKLCFLLSNITDKEFTMDGCITYRKS